MPFPSEPSNAIPTVASNASYSAPGDPWDGQPTKVAPSVSVQAQGFKPAALIAGDHLAYLFSTICAWLTYLVAFVTELRDSCVVGPASAADNRLVRFDGTTGKLVKTSDVVVDDSENISGVGNFTLAGEALYIAAKPFQRVVGIPSMRGWTQTVNSVPTTATSNDILVIDLNPYLQHGGQLTAVVVHLDPGAARPAGVNDRMKVYLRKKLFSEVSPALANAGTLISSQVEDNGTNAAHEVPVTVSATQVVDLETTMYYAIVESGDIASYPGTDVTYACRVHGTVVRVGL